MPARDRAGAEGEAARRADEKVHCDTSGGRFQARKDITHEILVAFAVMPGKESAVSIWRRSAFPEDASPTVAGHLGRFDADLKRAVEERSRGTAVKTEL